MSKSSFQTIKRHAASAVLLVLAFGVVGWRLTPVAAQSQPAGGAIQIGSGSAELRMGFVGDGIARIQLLPIDAQGSVIETSDEPHLVPQTWRGEMARRRGLPAERRVLSQGNVQLSLHPATWTVRLETVGGGPAQQVKIDPATGQVLFPIDGPLFGLGQGDQPHDRRGSINMQDVGGWRNSRHPMSDWGGHLGIPWVVSPKGWGIYFHSPAGTFDLTGENGVFARQAVEGRRGRRGGGRGEGRGEDRGGGAAAATPQPLDIFIVVAREPAGLMKAWAEITGYPSLPPIWSLGYIQSHREIETDELIRNVARTFREKKLPCDMLIYLGTGFAPVGWNTGHGEFTFNAQSFPKPEEQLKEFHDMHFRVGLHVTPQGANRVNRLTGRVTDDVSGTPYDANVAAHYWLLHAPLMKLGVDAWWPDEGETRFPAGRLARIQMYWEGPQQVFPDRRPFALHRTGAVGMQRYGGWLWSHDVKSTWTVLERHVPLGLNTVVSATPYWGSDTGGFYMDQNRELNGELFARWFQFSAFCPLFRSHGRDWRYRHLPWGFSNIEGPDHDPSIEGICKKYLDLRYQLMPYTYTVVYEAHETGMPIMRPLWLHYPQDATAVARGDEYLWGRDLLVAPVVKKGAVERTLYLPAGRWFDYWDETGAAIEGGREITRPVDLATMPLYVRAGAIVPHGPQENYTEEKPNDPLTIRVYPGADGRFTLIEDDGLTFSSRPMRLTFVWNDARRTLSVGSAPNSTPRDPMPRQLVIEVVGTPVQKSAEYRGDALELRF
jgi:alpha-glucosidase/alpha-D-xyloside xylohydrolase